MALFELIITCAGVILLAAAAAAGMILGRRAVFAGSLSGYGTPLALLLTLVLILFWRNEAAHSLWVSVLIFIAVPALFGAAAASVCAFRPVRRSFALAFGAGLLGGCSVLLRTVFGFRFDWTTPAAYAAYGLVLFLAGMGFVSAGRKARQAAGLEESAELPGEFAEAPQEAGGTQEAEEPEPSGSLILLAEPYVGQQISLPDGEELRLGSDAAYCHLILELPGRQPCLCGVRWLGARNTYLVTSYVFSGLLYEDGRPLPGNSSVEVKPGSLFLEGQTGQVLFQAG